MADQEFDSQVDELETEEGESGEETVTHQNGEMQNRIKALEAQQGLAALMADPDIRKIIEARQSGKKIQVSDLVENEGETEDETEEVDPEIAGMAEDDPAKEMLKKIDGLIQRKAGKLVDRIKELEAELNEVKGFAGDVQKKEVNAQIEAARKEFPDFDKYRDKMLKLSKENAGLGVKDLYYLAKIRSGDFKPQAPSSFSERPQGARRSQTGKPPGQKPQRPRGRAGFQQLLGEALEGLDFSPTE